MYRGHPNIQGASKPMGVQTYREAYGGIQTHPNIQEGIQTYGGIQLYGAYGHPLSLTKHAFFVLCMYRGHPNIQGASKPMGVQTYREAYGGIQTHPNIQEGIQTYGGIQLYGAYGHPLSLTKHAFFVLCMYRGNPNIWGHTIFFNSPELYLPSCFFLIFNILSIFSKYSFEFCTMCTVGKLVC